jgi:hypothetical protein
MTIEEQIECLRYYGRETEAREAENGKLVIPPDALNSAWTCMQLAKTASALADSIRCDCPSCRAV